MYVIVRHGAYDWSVSSSLNELGRRQVEVLAVELRKRLPLADSTEIWSSVADRAVETAQILIEGLGIAPLQSMEILGDKMGNKTSDPSLLVEAVTGWDKAHMRSVADVLVLVTHQPTIRLLIEQLCLGLPPSTIKSIYDQMTVGRAVLIEPHSNSPAVYEVIAPSIG